MMIKSDIDRMFSAAIKLRDTGQLREAADVLECLYGQLSPEDKYVASVSGMLGGIYYLSGDYVEAREWALKTTERSPTSELASVLLFHSYWKLNDIDGAIEEARRFLNLVPGSDYQGLKAALIDKRII